MLRFCTANPTHQWLVGCSWGKQLNLSPPQFSSFQCVLREHLQARLGARAWERAGKMLEESLASWTPQNLGNNRKHNTVGEEREEEPTQTKGSGRDFSLEMLGLRRGW